jgi:hypothetical protein
MVKLHSKDMGLQESIKKRDSHKHGSFNRQSQAYAFGDKGDSKRRSIPKGDFTDAYGCGCRLNEL